MNNSLTDDFDDAIEQLHTLKPTKNHITLEDNKGYRSQKRIDYDAIRTKYMAGEQYLRDDGVTVNRSISLREAASMFNVNYASVQLRAAKEGWKAMKDAFRAKLGEAAEGRAFTLYLDESVVADVNALSAVSKLTKIYNAYLEAKFGELITQIDDLETIDPEIIIERISIKDMRELIAIAKEIHALANSVTAKRNEKTLPIKEDVQKLNNTRGKYTADNSNEIEALKAKLKLIEDS